MILSFYITYKLLINAFLLCIRYDVPIQVCIFELLRAVILLADPHQQNYMRLTATSFVSRKGLTIYPLTIANQICQII